MAVPVYVKGGSWTQTEDQILKAAVSKYGLQKWNKIASLILKKTGPQCKQRWEEYLNPLLNFQSFTTTEDSKLMELAKYYPNQWRTIADIMGRTAQLCIDRYNQLISKMASTDMDIGKGPFGSYSLKVGETNPNNETLPAKPSVVSSASKDKNLSETDQVKLQGLVDDEREMVADAKARLMNTQGRKASKKARERMLEESKKIALIQKRRELKQAGIHTKLDPPKKGKYDNAIDYNAEVVYEHQPLPGRFDTSKEVAVDEKNKERFEKKVDREGLKRVFKDFEKQSKSVSDSTEDGSDAALGSNKKQKIFNAQEETKHVSGADMAINEFKKPILDLSFDGLRDKDSPISTATDGVSRAALESKKQFVHELLANLPPPLNDFEIVVDESRDDEMPAVQKDHMETKYNKNFKSGQTIAPNTPSLENGGIVGTHDYYIAKANQEIDAICCQTHTDMNRHANLPSMTQPLFDKTEPRLAEVTFLEKNIKDLNRAILHLQKLNRYISEQVIETNENLKTKIVTELTPEYLFATSAYRNEYYKYLNTMNAISVRRKRLLNDLNLAKK
ncbi:Pre-mRNA-splicing factor CEF1 [Hanseniaspora osmophila]|uniref:Pre-mRNA-splicing factor CEF1 n=1 Tax=Hanseniaspora osmophila TaxID=56408 RepID=A0A1E5R802_9ASCO|nr:Pre-mRNA-splicing factor CEF1 [Hanseniaspora osmophila]